MRKNFKDYQILACQFYAFVASHLQKISFDLSNDFHRHLSTMSMHRSDHLKRSTQQQPSPNVDYDCQVPFSVSTILVHNLRYSTSTECLVCAVVDRQSLRRQGYLLSMYLSGVSVVDVSNFYDAASSFSIRQHELFSCRRHSNRFHRLNHHRQNGVGCRREMSMNFDVLRCRTFFHRPDCFDALEWRLSTQLLTMTWHFVVSAVQVSTCLNL